MRYHFTYEIAALNAWWHRWCCRCAGMASLTRSGRSCKPGQGLWKAIWEHIFQSWSAGNESTKIAVHLSTTCNGKKRKQPHCPSKKKKLAAPVFTMNRLCSHCKEWVGPQTLMWKRYGVKWKKRAGKQCGNEMVSLFLYICSHISYKEHILGINKKLLRVVLGEIGWSKGG